MKIETIPIEWYGHKGKNSLFHYCKLETALEFILPSRQLLLNPIERTNDPRENQEFAFAYRYSGDDTDDYLKNKHLISESLRSGCKVICFSQNWKDYFGYELSRMWSEYGNKHSGVCLEIDRRAFYEENKSLIDRNHFDEVSYFHLDVKKPRNHIVFDYSDWKKHGNKWLFKFRDEYAKDLFFVKNAEWEWEREFRLIFFSDDQNNEYCSIAKSLRNIYLGIGFHDAYLPSIRHEVPETSIYKMFWNDVRLTPTILHSPNR